MPGKFPWLILKGVHMGVIKRRITEYKQGKAAKGIIRSKARAAYLQEKQKQAIVYAKNKAVIERQRKEQKLRLRPMFYKEAYRAAGRLGRNVDPNRAYQPARRRAPPQRRRRKRRSYVGRQNQFYDDSMTGGYDF